MAEVLVYRPARALTHTAQRLYVFYRTARRVVKVAWAMLAIMVMRAAGT